MYEHNVQVILSVHKEMAMLYVTVADFPNVTSRFKVTQHAAQWSYGSNFFQLN